jgi:hypothetical protein
MFSLRPWQIWLAAAACLSLVISTLGWLTMRAIAADQAAQLAAEQAALEENIRLALWRIDTQMAAFISDESARPIHNYQAALSMPGAQAPNSAAPPEELILVSPLINPGVPEIFA